MLFRSKAANCFIINVTERGIVASEIMLLREDMRRSSVKEYAEALKERYRKAGRGEKGRILDEFTEVTGYHRKSAIRLLSGDSTERSGMRRGRPAQYGPEVKAALKVVWESTDRLCGKRLAPFLAELVRKLSDHGELEVSDRKSTRLNSSHSSVSRMPSSA